MKALTTLALSALTLLPYVSAHGFVSNLVIDGTSYKGNTPNDDNPFPSVVRQISTTSPVKGASNPDLNCGASAQKAALVANAQSGSKLQFFWAAGGGQNWPHNTGPIITYMASCGDTPCDEFDSTHAGWFKIDESGQNASYAWPGQDALMAGNPFELTLPANIAPGGYLLRHEIIALHLAVTEGGAEFYPSCSQINVTGSGTGFPASTVAFPGAYSDDDPGIFDVHVFDDNPAFPYVFPGPALTTFTANGSSSSSSPPTSAPAPSPSVASSPPPPPPQNAGTTTCKLGQKKRMVKRHAASLWAY